MTFGIGSPAIASSSAACNACASGTAGVRASAKSISVLPSILRLKVEGSAWPSPAASSFLRSAVVGWPLASSATAAGMSFISIARGSLPGFTFVMSTPSRRGVAKARSMESCASISRLPSPFERPSAKASPRRWPMK